MVPKPASGKYANVTCTCIELDPAGAVTSGDNFG